MPAMVGVGGRSTRVLGLRDVLDTDDAVIGESRQCDTAAAIEHYYDEVWVYGDPAVSLRVPFPLRSPGGTRRSATTA